MDEKYRNTRSEKSEKNAPDEYNDAPKQAPQYAPPQFAPPEAGPSNTTPYVPPPPTSVVPTVSTNGINLVTVFESIRGSWLLDPLLPRSSSRSILQAFLEFRSGRSRLFQNMSGGTPSANMVSWRGNIFATLRVVEESDLPETAVIRSTTYSGNVVIELVSKAPSKNVNFDLFSRTGNISLLIPRGFSGTVELRGQRGYIELLPALAPYARVERMTDSEAIVFIGNMGPPAPGFGMAGDLARLHSLSGRVRLGFCGEDSFTDRGTLIGQIFQRITA